jgi:hypothetical protein
VPSSPRCFRAWQTRKCLARRLLTASTSASTLFDCLDASPSSSVLGGFPFALLPSAPPRAPAASCAAPYPRQPRQLHVDHGYPTSSTTTIHPPVWLHGTKGYHPHEFLAGFLSSRSVYTTFQLRGMSVHWLSPTASSLVSPSVVLPL